MSTYDVFISYSRRDTSFVRELFDALNAQDRDAWVDWQGIDYSTQWWEEICTGVERSDNFVLVISPASLNSVYCHREIEHARKHNKRIIPFIYREVDEASLLGGWYTSKELRSHEALARQNWEHLKTIQWIDFPKLGDFNKAFTALVDTVNTNPVYVQTHTRLLLRVRDWENTGRSPSVLLRGEELAIAERWLETSRHQAPQATAEQHQFILQSRLAENEANALAEAQENRRKALELQTKEAAQENQRLANRTRIFRRAAVLFSVVGIAALLGTFIAVTQGNEARNQAALASERENISNTKIAVVNATLTPIPPTLTAVADQINRGEARIESLALAGYATEILQDETGNPENAALLAIRALNTAYTEQADDALFRALNFLPEQSILIQHQTEVKTLAVSPDGQYIASGGGDFLMTDNAVRLWSTATGDEVRTFTPQNGAINVVAFSPDGSILAAAGDDSMIRLWSTETGDVLQIIPVELTIIRTLAFAPDGQHIASGGSTNVIHLWDISTGTLVHTYEGFTDQVSSLAFAHDGQYLVAGSWDGTVSLWNAATSEIIRTIDVELRGVNSISVSPDDQYILTGSNCSSQNCTVKLWHLETAELIQSFSGFEGAVDAVAFSPDGNSVLTAARDRTVRLWDVMSGQQMEIFSEQDGWVWTATFSPNGKSIVSGSQDGIIRVRPIRGDSLSFDFIPDGLYGGVTDVQFSPDGSKLLISYGSYATGRAGKLIAWDNSTGAIIQDFVGHEADVNSVAWSPDGNLILSGGGDLNGTDSTARLWDANAGQEIKVLLGHQDRVTSVAFSPDGHLALTGSDDGTARLWDVSTGDTVSIFASLGSYVTDVAFSPDGKFVVLAVADSEIGKSANEPKNNVAELWSIADLERVQVFSGHEAWLSSVAFSSDGLYVLTGSGETGANDNTARLWHAATGELIHTFEGHAVAIRDVEFSHDGHLIMTADWTGRVQLWDTTTFALVRVLPNTEDSLRTAAFSPDDQHLVLGYATNVSSIQHTDVAAFVAFACSRVRRDLTAETKRQYFIFDDRATCSASLPGA